MSSTPDAPSAPETDAEMRHLQALIAQAWAMRERLKADLETGALPVADLRALDALDRDLSELDTRYKQLWDATHGQPRESS